MGVMPMGVMRRLAARVGPEELEHIIAPCVAILAAARSTNLRLPLSQGAGEAVTLKSHPHFNDRALVVIQSMFKVDRSLGVARPVHSLALGQVFALHILHAIEVLDGSHRVFRRGLSEEAVVLALVIHD